MQNVNELKLTAVSELLNGASVADYKEALNEVLIEFLNIPDMDPADRMKFSTLFKYINHFLVDVEKAEV